MVDRTNQNGMGKEIPFRVFDETGRMIRGLLRFPLSNVKCIRDFYLEDEQPDN